MQAMSRQLATSICYYLQAGISLLILIKLNDENEKAMIKAEVRFLRAYEYFYLSLHYGGVPLVAKGSDN